jgi:outer membrane protein assembly factor BamE (lipoprotein component of BamABCDE complex)
MWPSRQQALRRISLAAALGAILAGCAGPAPPPSPLPQGISPQAAQAAVVPGRSTKTDVLAALGKATVLTFDSGSELWVYRKPGEGRDPRTESEFVVLFTPNGVVKKTRVKPAYPPRE